MSTSLQRLNEDIGRIVRDVRTSLRLSQRELSRRSKIPQSRISLIERGLARRTRLAEIDRLFQALGVGYRLEVDRPHVADRGLSDAVHARCSAHAQRRLLAAGWVVEREVEVGSQRSRGWVDLLAFEPRSQVLLVIEIKTEILDLGDIERTLNWYTREAPGAARRFGWTSARVASAVLVLQTAVNDRRISDLRPVVQSALPGRASDLREVVGGLEAGGKRRFLAMIDPTNRHAEWLRAPTAFGRRTRAPFEDYIDAVRQLEARGRQRRGRAA